MVLEPSNYVIKHFKLLAAIFLLILEGSNSPGLFRKTLGGGGGWRPASSNFNGFNDIEPQSAV